MPDELSVTLWAVWLFVFGACVGSFLNVCIYRLPAGLSVVWPPSHCTTCLKRIAWHDNLPILGWFLLRGRCRHCGERFSAQYAGIEALTGLVFAGFYLAYFVWQVRGPDLARWDVYLVHMALLSALIVCSVIDLRTKEIYTVVTYGGMAVAVVLSALLPALQAPSHVPQWFAGARLSAVVSSLLGLVVGGAIVWVTALLGRLVLLLKRSERRDAMGFGDVLLVAMIGAVLGWEGAVLTFFLAPFFGLTYGLWQLARHRDHEVPYGPFLSMGAGAVMLAQRGLVAWFGPGVSAIWQVIGGG